jgi:hypothetical protein
MPKSEHLPLVALEKSMQFEFDQRHLNAQGQEMFDKI